jgi:V/A-type H+-transporting ATPase subunit D
MSEKIKLNKNSLREQVQSLKLYLEFLPTLELRKQQLQTEVRKARAVIDAARSEFSQYIADAGSWKGLLSSLMPKVKDLLSIEEVSTKMINVAGVKVPEFKEIRFAQLPYSLVATNWALDAALHFYREALTLQEKIRILEQKLERIERELIKTTQRINLYEKVLIPQTRENIRKIKVYLGDQQTAAVCRAKIAKNKIVQKAQATQA